MVDTCQIFLFILIFTTLITCYNLKPQMQHNLTNHAKPDVRCMRWFAEWESQNAGAVAPPPQMPDSTSDVTGGPPASC